MARYNKRIIKEHIKLGKQSANVTYEYDTSGPDIINRAGGRAFSQSPKLEFVSLLLTSFVQGQFYRTEEESIDRVKELISAGIKDYLADEKDRKFYAKAALYARNNFGMRSISHIVAAEIAKYVKGETWLKDFFDKIVHRVDDMMEILSFYAEGEQSNSEKEGVHPIPNAMKKGFAKAFEKFDQYQIAKYRGIGKQIKLVDLVNLIHPKPGEKSAEGLRKLIKDELRAETTWEAKISKAGRASETEEQKVEAKSEAWAEMITSKRLGYMAAIKNARNILESVSDSTIIARFCEQLLDKNAIRQSLILPFRFITAIEQLQGINQKQTVKVASANLRSVLTAMSKALELSVDNCPAFDGNTLIAFDGSGSMFSLNGESQKMAKTGSIFAAILYKRSPGADLLVFSNDAKYITLNSADSLTSLAKNILDASPKQGTNYMSIFEAANKAYDRIIILSDAQGWIHGGEPSVIFSVYRNAFGCHPHVYSVDLAGYGDMMFPEPQVYCLAGLSDKIFDVMKSLEQDKNALINEIEKVSL